jgi:hypothetical protein
LMSRAASKAVDPFARHRVHLKFFPFLTKHLNASHIHERCHIPDRLKRFAYFPILMSLGKTLESFEHSCPLTFDKFF